MVENVHMSGREASYDSLLMQYAAGTLDIAQSLIVGTHIGLSPGGRRALHQFESLAGALLEQQCSPTAMRPGALENVMNRLERAAQAPRPAEKPRCLPEDLDLPACLEAQLRKHLEHQRRMLAWKRMYEGVQAMQIPLKCRRSRASLYRLTPGLHRQETPRAQLNITLVLDGSLIDENGTYTLGDLIIHEAQTRPLEQEARGQKGCTTMTVYSGQMHRADSMRNLLSHLMGLTISPPPVK